MRQDVRIVLPRLKRRSRKKYSALGNVDGTYQSKAALSNTVMALERAAKIS